MKKYYIILLVILPLLAINSVQAYDGKVINAKTKAPIQDAIVTSGNEVTRTDANGMFHLDGSGLTLRLRAAGYARKDFDTANLNSKKLEIPLNRFYVKGLYLSDYGLASDKIRTAALETMKKNKMNALVIDFKGDHGFIPFKVDIPLAEEIGAQKIILKNLPELLENFKKQGIYLIARIVVFKDDMLAGTKTQWAVKKGNDVFRDREKLRWVDPFNQQVWNYNIEIAKAAAKMGFDEIQFDYVRCPDTKGVIFSKPSNMETRTQTITGFLEAAHKALIPYNVMVAADIFGYVIWNVTDTGIGQQIEKAVQAVDIVSPMLYPSGFEFGIPHYRNPIKSPFEIVFLTLQRAGERTHISPLRFRPWLQAFRDYAFGKEQFTPDKMRLQIKAAKKFGTSGYMFWNARNVYTTEKFTGKNNITPKDKDKNMMSENNKKEMHE